MTTRFYGIYRGVVYDNNDPNGTGRLRLQVPQLLGTTPTEWAWPKEEASLRLKPPAFGQGVWIMFEGGDPHFPVWTGTFGKHVTADKSIYVSPLSSSTSLTGLGGLINTVTSKDGTIDIDLTSSLMSIATRVANGIYNLDGGVSDSIYGGVTGIDGGGV